MNSYRSTILLLLMCTWLMVFLTGCWNNKELSAISVVMAMGIDAVDDQYEVSLQVVDPSQMSRNSPWNGRQRSFFPNAPIPYLKLFEN